MRHKWKPIPGTPDLPGITSKISKTKECVNCGLKKGSIIDRPFYRTVYYRDRMFLKFDSLPYSCQPILKPLNEDFISIDEFKFD